jgi:hypothetical protein
MRAFAIGALVLLGIPACHAVPPLGDTYRTPEGLATAVLQALADADRERLDALALSEQEFRDHVWPELPAARPERNLPFSYVWGDLRQKSQLGLSATLKDIEGRRYVLERVTFSGETSYPHFRVHRDATFHVRDVSGAESTLRVCGSMIEKAGEWKIFSYVID